MKHAITMLAATAAFAFSEDKSVTEKARDTAAGVVDKTREVARDAKDAVVGVANKVGDVTRSGWKKTKAYLSEDEPTYRDGAAQTLADLGKEIREVKAMTPSVHPPYFHTRLQALDQQHEYLGTHLTKLSSEHIKARLSGDRYAFDQCVENLEAAIDQARHEAATLSKVVQK